LEASTYYPFRKRLVCSSCGWQKEVYAFSAVKLIDKARTFKRLHARLDGCRRAARESSLSLM
jgi:hypothetical protein